MNKLQELKDAIEMRVFINNLEDDIVEGIKVRNLDYEV